MRAPPAARAPPATWSRGPLLARAGRATYLIGAHPDLARSRHLIASRAPSKFAPSQRATPGATNNSGAASCGRSRPEWRARDKCAHIYNEINMKLLLMLLSAPSAWRLRAYAPIESFEQNRKSGEQSRRQLAGGQLRARAPRPPRTPPPRRRPKVVRFRRHWCRHARRRQYFAFHSPIVAPLVPSFERHNCAPPDKSADRPEIVGAGWPRAPTRATGSIWRAR